MRIQNVDEMIYAEQQRRMGSGNFGYGDFGSAVADYIIDNQEDKSWTDQQLTNAKIKWREMVLAIENAVRSRNDAIAAIKSMPAGEAKNQAIAKFSEADGYFMQGYQQAQPLFQKIGALTGDSFSNAVAPNFGAVPLAAAWALAAAAMAIIGIVIANCYEARVRYDALLQNPEVAKYDTGGGFFSNFGTSLGDGMKWAIIGVAGLFIASQVFKSRSA